VRAQQAVVNPRVFTARSPSGVEFEITVCEAPELAWWVTSPARVMNTFRRNRRFWVTVESGEAGMALLKEHSDSEAEAVARAEQLFRDIGKGDTSAVDSPALRRRRIVTRGR
jgi:hypothetical protein